MAGLSQEYQVDWLSNEVKKYLSGVVVADIDSLINYLKLSIDMGFGRKVESHLKLLLSFETFPNIQRNPLFVSFSRQIQIQIATKRMKELLDHNDFGSSAKTLASFLYYIFFKD